jgi:transcriptional regulator GlxA family with amidase domain
MWSPLKSAGFYVRKYESADMMYILCTRIISALRSQDVYSIQLAKESASMMLVLLQREFDQADNPWHSKRISNYLEIINLIHENPDQQWDRETIAKRLNISTRLMTSEFKRNFNMAPAQMVKNIRMEHAAQQLINTERKLYDIAPSIGYESPFSFSRIFKKHFGVSPNQYRNMSLTERQKLILDM